MFLTRFWKRSAVTALTATVALAAGASSASAGVLVASAPDCDQQSTQKTFLPWWDIADYTALSGGDFEGAGDGWSMTGGAAIGGGNEPYYVGDSGDSHSLSLPAGASATSPAICVGLVHPTIRFFAKRQSGGWLSLSSVRVDVLFETSTGQVASLPIGVAGNGGSWQPTSPMLVVANLLPLLPGERTPVAFRFTAQGADYSVDDVWVDPYGRK
ncbi:MAG: hypothetical protein Q8K79_10045 [Solirubrobacteraceae bacterium]|nr:hypothetical protein [Solirubrobacteraceae bacterium]